MAAGTLLTVLSNIPWGQVVDNAPKLVEGAGKLWKMVTRQKNPTDSESKNPVATPDDGQTMKPHSTATDNEKLHARIVELHQHIRSLEEQMTTSADLIKGLAEQNNQMVQKIVDNSARLWRMAKWVGAAFIVTWGLIYFTVAHSSPISPISPINILSTNAGVALKTSFDNAFMLIHAII